MSNLVDHARRELTMCGQFEEDAVFAQSLVAAVAAFDSYPGHSGSSAEAGIQMLGDLLRFKNLSELTSDEEEWQEVGPRMWQNVRNSEAFSQDAGKTHYLLSDHKNEDGSFKTIVTKMKYKAPEATDGK